MASVPNPRPTPGTRPAQSETSIRASLVLGVLCHFLEHDDLFQSDLYRLAHKHRTVFREIELADRRGIFSSIGWRDVQRFAASGHGDYRRYHADLLSILERNNLAQIPEAAESFHGWVKVSSDLRRKATATLLTSFEDLKPPGFRDITVRVSINEEWLIDRDPRSRIRRRILAQLTEQLDAELDRIVAEHDHWRWMDTEHGQALHIEWTCRRLKGESVQHIADHPRKGDPGRGRTAISSATNKIAKTIGLTFPGT